MKNLVIVICLLFTPSAFAELTPADVQTISNIVEKAVSASEKRTREYIDLKLEGLESRFTGKITTLENRLTTLENRLTTLENRLTTLEGKIADLLGRIEGVDRNMNLLVILVTALIALLVLAIGIPQLILVARQRNQNEMQKGLEAMQIEMQELRKELAPLLQDR